MVDSNPPKDHPSYSPFTLALGLIILVAAAYFSSLFCGFIWDDDVGIIDNENLRSLGGLWRIWTDPDRTPQGHYWPLVDVSFWLEYRVWGLNPIGYHLTNILLQMVNTLLVWRLLLRLEVSGAWFAAAMFGVHPIQVESVAWIIERKNLLSGLFLFLSIHSFLTFRRTGSGWAWGGAFAAFVLGMLSKSSVYSLPFLLAVLIYWKSSSFKPREYLTPILFLALGSVIAWWDVSLVHQREVIDHGLTFLDRMTIAGKAFWFYLAKTAFPADLVAVYPRWDPEGFTRWSLLWPASVLFIGMLFGWIAHRGERGPFVAFLAYVFCLGPTLGLVDFGFMVLSFVADRFSYLAVIPVFVLVCSGGVRLIRRTESQDAWQAVALMVLVVLTLVSARQCLVYRDQETLVKHNLSRHPEAWVVRYNYAVDLADMGRLDEAVGQYRLVLESNPSFADAMNNLGAVYVRMGEFEKGRIEFQRILEIDPKNSRAHRNLGAVHSRKGEWQEALEHFRSALETEPEDEELRRIVRELSQMGLK